MDPVAQLRRVRRLSTAGDVALAAAVSVTALAELWYRDTGSFPIWGAAPVVLVVTASLAWRRSLPVLGAIVVLVGTAGLLLAGLPMDNLGLFVTTLVTAYSLGAHATGGAAHPAVLVSWLAAVFLATALAVPIAEAGGLAVLVTAASVGGRLLSHRGKKVQQLRGETARLAAERDERAAAAVADERARIARELHDVVAHSMSVMVLQAGAGRRVLRDDPDHASDLLRSLEGTGRQAMSEMKRLVGIMREGSTESPLAPQPGLAQVDDLADSARAAGMEVDVQIQGDPVPLPPGLDLAAYRIVQEGLTNAIKHAGPGNVTVEICYDERQIRLRVRDHGRDRARVPAPDAGVPSHGIVGMQERVALYGGDLSVRRVPEGGVEVHARLPVEDPVR